MEFFERVRQTRGIRAVNRFINSKYMLAVLAILTVLTNFYALEFWTYTIAAVVGIYLCLFGKDMRLLGPMVIFLYISPSMGNNPYYNPNSVFFPEHGLIYFIVCIALFVALFLWRVISTKGIVSFIKEKRQLCLGFLLLGAAFLVGGLGYQGYGALGYESYVKYFLTNLLYSVVLFGSLFILYFFLTATVDWKDVSKDYFAWTGLFLGLIVTAELIYIYLTDDVIQAGVINRGKIITGWGTYNNMGVLIAVGMPCAFYLAATKQCGFIFNLLGNLLFVSLIFSNSRASILMGAVLYLFCVVATLWKKRRRLENLITFFVVFLIGGIVVGMYWDTVFNAFSVILDDGYFFHHDSSRIEMYEQGCKQILESPILGQGFFANPFSKYNPGGITLMPKFWHNTFIQMLAACGVVGMAVYFFHRYQTILLFVKKPNLAKTSIAIAIAAILLTSLLDCHLFTIGGGFVYSVLLVFAEKDGMMKKEEEEDLLVSLFRRIKSKKVQSV